MGKNNKGTQGTPAVVQTAATPVVEKKKWFEMDGAFTLEKDDIVYIDPTHEWFGNRFGVIIEPSQKQNAVRGKLLNPKTGEPQGTIVVMDMSKVTVIAKDGVGSDVLPELAAQYELVDGLYKQVTMGNENELQQAQ